MGSSASPWSRMLHAACSCSIQSLFYTPANAYFQMLARAYAVSGRSGLPCSNMKSTQANSRVSAIDCVYSALVVPLALDTGTEIASLLARNKQVMRIRISVSLMSVLNGLCLSVAAYRIDRSQSGWGVGSCDLYTIVRKTQIDDAVA